MTWENGQTYSQRVWTAYRALAAETKFIDVPIHSLHRRVGGSIHELHDWLRQECYAHRAVPTVGEPAFAGDAARQSALTLSEPGASETFLNIKLLPPPMIQEQREAQPDHERYEELLRATAELRYPPEERTPELEARIEKTIARKVGEFRQERALKAYEAGLRKELEKRHANLTPNQAKHYEQRIGELVAEFQKNQTQRQQQQAQPAPARSQQQGKGMEQSL
jgi:hypothetical protein